MQQKKLLRIFSWAFVYIIVLCSILFAFPKKFVEVEQKENVYAAPSIKTKGGYSLPVHIIQGGSISAPEKTVQTTTPPQPTQNIPVSTITSSSNSTQKPVTPTQTATSNKLSCATLNLCDKIIINDGYTVAQRAVYYNALLQTVKQLTEVLPSSMNLTDSLYSITLSPKADADRRGRGGSKTIIINTASINTIQEFREVLTHELGHVVDLGLLVGTSYQKNAHFMINNSTLFAVDDPSLSFYSLSWDNSSTRKASASYTDFVGGYAMTNSFEDFAESFALYLRHNKVFTEMARGSSILAQKYAFMDKLFNGKYYQDDIDTANIIKKTPKRRPWDTTRLSVE